MKKHRAFRCACGFVLAAVMTFTSLPVCTYAAKSSSEIQSEIDSLKQENKGIQAQIDAIQKQYDANASEIGELVAKKDAIDQEIALINAQIDNLNAQITAFGQMIADAQDEMDLGQLVLNGLNEKHKLRIRAMEEGGGVSYWEVVFEASSFTDMLDRINMMQEIAASDQARLNEMREAAEVIQTAQEQMQLAKDELEGSSLELESSYATLEKKRTESDDILRELAAKQEEFQQMLDESEAMQHNLMAEIAQKEKDLADAKYEERLALLAQSGNCPPSDATWITPGSGHT